VLIFSLILPSWITLRRQSWRISVFLLDYKQISIKSSVFGVLGCLYVIKLPWLLSVLSQSYVVGCCAMVGVCWQRWSWCHVCWIFDTTWASLYTWGLLVSCHFWFSIPFLSVWGYVFKCYHGRNSNWVAKCTCDDYVCNQCLKWWKWGRLLSVLEKDKINTKNKLSSTLVFQILRSSSIWSLARSWIVYLLHKHFSLYLIAESSRWCNWG
jgi:hypothetical protein